jgi:hypothetical protein
MSRKLQRIPLRTGPLRLLVPIVALAAAVCPAGAQPTNTFSDLPCAVFLDLPAPAGSGTPFLPFSVPLCGGGQVNVTTRSHPLRAAPFTDNPFYTGTFSFSLSGGLKEPIDPAVNPGDYDGRYQSRGTAGWDLLLDFDVPIASFGMSTMMSRYYPLGISDRMRLFDGPLGTGNLVAEAFSQGNPVAPVWHAVRFTGYDAGSPVIRSVVIDVQSDVDGNLFLDGLVFGPAQTGTSAAGDTAQPALVFHPAAPNPFNPRTTIRYDLANAGHVRLGLFDVRGRLVRQLAEGERPAGAHAVLLDGGDLASGIYLLRLTGPGGQSATQRITLVR